MKLNTKPTAPNGIIWIDYMLRHRKRGLYTETEFLQELLMDMKQGIYP